MVTTKERVNGKTAAVAAPPRKRGRPVMKRVGPPASEEVVIPPLNIETFQIKIVGDSELITHAWSQKAIQMIEDKQRKVAAQAREAKNPEEEYQAAFYRMQDGRPALPTLAFKNAAVTACTHVADMTKVAARGAFHVQGDLVPIEGKPEKRRDMVRIGMGVADIRYRPGWKEWSTVLTIRHNARMISAAQVVNLFNTAGFAVGVGEHRPEKDGSCGMFHVEPAG